MGLVSLLFSFKGRVNRAQYWLGTLGVGFAGGFVICFCAFASGASIMSAKTAGEAFGAVMGFMVVLLPLMLFMSWSGLAIQVKRFHDRGRTGYLCLLPLVVMFPMMMTLMGGVFSGAPVQAVANSIQPYVLVLWAINLWFFIDLGCLPGQDGPNRFGNPPGSGSPQTKRADGATASSLFGAQSAMDRAIAEQGKAQAAPQQRPAVATAPRPATPSGSPSFGRRTAH